MTYLFLNDVSDYPSDESGDGDDANDGHDVNCRTGDIMNHTISAVHCNQIYNQWGMIKNLEPLQGIDLS